MGTMQKVYSATDDIMKMAAFKSLLEMGYQPKNAINQVKEGFQNYRRVGKAYDLFSKAPLIGNPFGKFAGDLQRIVTKGITQRPLTTMGFLMAIKLMSLAFSRMSGEDDRRRRIREGRMGFPKIPFPDALGGDIPLAFKLNGDEMNVARFLSPIYLYSSGDGDAFEFMQKLSPQPLETPGDYTKNPNGAGSVIVAKNANDPVLAPLFQMMFNSDFRGAPIYDPKQTQYRKATLTKEERGANALRFVLRAYIPWQVAVNFLGVKITEFPETRYGQLLEQRLNNYGYQFKETEEAIRLLGKQKSKGEITAQQYMDRVVPQLEAQADIVTRAKEEYNKLKGEAGSIPLMDFDPSVSKAKGRQKKLPSGPVMPTIAVPNPVQNIPSP
jgi:hypothetical protein